MHKNIPEQTIFIISDQLENHLDYISPSNEFNILLSSLDTIEKKCRKIHRKERQNILVVINEDLYITENKNKIKKSFSDKLDIADPFCLLIINDNNKEDYENHQNIFTYKILECGLKEKEINNFIFYIKIIFQRIQDLHRLDNYIINSFRTIIDSEIVNKQKKEIEELYLKLEELSKIDYLTKVLNRKAFFHAMETEKKRSVRNIARKTTNDKIMNNRQNDTRTGSETKPKNDIDYYCTFACMMLDIDHFKMINDTHGHLIGDKVLKKLGELLLSKKIFRDNDIIGRYGGEEFIILLPGADSTTAQIPAERLRKEVNKLTFKGFEDKDFHIRISIGISDFSQTEETNEDIINRADQALYYAKKHGRDQIIIYNDIKDKL